MDFLERDLSGVEVVSLRQLIVSSQKVLQNFIAVPSRSRALARELFTERTQVAVASDPSIKMVRVTTSYAVVDVLHEPFVLHSIGGRADHRPEHAVLERSAAIE